MTLGETLGGAAKDVGDLALENHSAVPIGRLLEHLDQRFEWIQMFLPSFAEAPADRAPELDGAVDGGAFGGGAVHGVFGDVGAAALAIGDPGREPLHHLVVVCRDDSGVAVL